MSNASTFKPPDGYELFGQEGSFLDHVGPIYARKLDDHIETLLPIQDYHVNSIGIAHGGLMMTLMDITLGGSAGAMVNHVGAYPTVSLTVNMVRAVRASDVLAGTAEVTKITGTLAFVSGWLSVDDEVVMTATGVFRNPKGVSGPDRKQDI